MVRAAIATAVAVIALVAPASSATTEVLSHPGDVSRWAFVLRQAIVREQPDPNAAAVARLRLRTEDRTDELVLALERFTDDSGRRWVRVRLPVLPNNTTG